MVTRPSAGKGSLSIPRYSAWRMTLAYIVVGVAWIVITDLASIGAGDSPTFTVSLVKGIFWIVASGLLLHILVFRRIARARSLEASVRRRLLEGEEVGRFGIAESLAGEVRARWSDGMFRLWGRSPAEGEPDATWLVSQIDPLDLDQARIAAEAAVRGDSPPPYDLRIRSEDGVDRVLRFTTKTLRERQGRIRTLVVAQDVSELRALEQNASASLALLRSVVESTAEGIIVLRSDTKEILLWNDRAVELTRIPREVFERLDGNEAETLFVERVRDKDSFFAQAREIALASDTSYTDLIEMKDGTILERYTAPVAFEGEPKARIWTLRDVTERTRARNALERRERQLAQSQRIARLGSYELNLESGALFWSNEMYRILGLNSAEVEPSIPTFRAMVVSDDLPAFESALAAGTEGRIVNPFRVRIVLPDGRIRVFEGRGEPHSEGNERVIIGTLQDVTEEHATMRALAEAEERFRATFEQAAVGIAHLASDRTIVRVNETLCAAVGFSREELIGRPSTQLIDPADWSRSRNEIDAVFRDDSRSRTWEMRYLTKTGRSLWAEVTISAARFGRDASYLIVVAQDISERKRNEDERERLARQVRLLLGSTEAGLLTVDLEGRCTLINRAARESLGYSEEEILGRPARFIVFGGDVPNDVEGSILRANQGKPTKLYDHRFVRRDGSLLPCDITVSPIVEDGTVIGRAISFVDVSDRMRLEEQLEEAKRLSSLGRLAATIAHEINNVLMGILPFAEIVSRSKETVFSNAGQQIRQSVQRGRGVTQDILRFARQENPERHVFEGGPWLHSIQGELRQIAGHAWSMAVPSEPFFVDADASQLSQVLINLTVNAADAIDAQKGRIELAVDLREPGTVYSFGALPQRGHRWVWLRVTDNGAGMDAETLQHLFEPFFTKKRGGTGLGLPIAYRIIAAHGGLFFVESAVGKGSTFHIFLPEAQSSGQQAATESRDERDLSGDVLLVEDDEAVAAGLSMMLEEAGMRPRTVGSGAAALTEIENRRPTLMILDVGLPDMDGATVCERALARWPGLPIIISTGHGEASRLGACLDKPNVRFLRKPYMFEQLRGAIEAVIPNGS